MDSEFSRAWRGDPVDEELLRRAAAGDPAARDRFARYCYGWVTHWAARMLPPADAEDAVQEVLLQALRDLGQVRSSDYFCHWLHTLTVRICVRLRGRRARCPVESLDGAEGEPLEFPANPATQPETRLLDGLFREQVRHAVHHLSEPYRLTVTLHYFDGLPATEIARRQRVPPATVRTRLFTARQMLQRRLAF